MSLSSSSSLGASNEFIKAVFESASIGDDGRDRKEGGGEFGVE